MEGGLNGDRVRVRERFGAGVRGGVSGVSLDCNMAHAVAVRPAVAGRHTLATADSWFSFSQCWERFSGRSVESNLGRPPSTGPPPAGGENRMMQLQSDFLLPIIFY